MCLQLVCICQEEDKRRGSHLSHCCLCFSPVNPVTVDVAIISETPTSTFSAAFLVPHLPCSLEKEIGSAAWIRFQKTEGNVFFSSPLPHYGTVVFTSPANRAGGYSSYA